MATVHRPKRKIESRRSTVAFVLIGAAVVALIIALVIGAFDDAGEREAGLDYDPLEEDRSIIQEDESLEPFESQPLSNEPGLLE